MILNIVTSKDKRGEERLKRLLPQLSESGFEYKLHYINLNLDPMEATFNIFKSIYEENKLEDYYIYVEDDALIKEGLSKNELIRILEYNNRESASIVSLGSHNYGQSKVLKENLISLDSMYGLQFIIVYKKGYELIKEYKLEVEQDRHIEGKKEHSLRTVIPYLVTQDNLEGSRIKRYKRDEEEFFSMYEKRMKEQVLKEYCK